MTSRLVAALFALTVLGCSQGPTAYQCEAGQVTPRSDACDPHALPLERQVGTPWTGCEPPDSWRVVVYPDGSTWCGSGYQPTATPPIACDADGGDTLCPWGCGWVPLPPETACAEMLADCSS